MVFIGTTVTEIAVIVSGGPEFGDFDLLIGVLGLVAVITIVILISRMAKKALREEMEIPE